MIWGSYLTVLTSISRAWSCDLEGTFFSFSFPFHPRRAHAIIFHPDILLSILTAAGVCVAGLPFHWLTHKTVQRSWCLNLSRSAVLPPAHVWKLPRAGGNATSLARPAASLYFASHVFFLWRCVIIYISPVNIYQMPYTFYGSFYGVLLILWTLPVGLHKIKGGGEPRQAGESHSLESLTHCFAMFQP